MTNENKIKAEDFLRAVDCCVAVAAQADESTRFVRLETAENGLCLSAYNGWVWGYYDLPGTHMPADCLLWPKDLTDITKPKHKANHFSVTIGEKRVQVVAGDSSYLIPFAMSAKWAEEPRIEQCQSMELARADFEDAIDKLEPAMGDFFNHKNGTGSGIAVSTSEKSARFLSFSNQRASLLECPAKFVNADCNKYFGLLPRECVYAIKKSIVSWGDRVTLRSNGRAFEVSSHPYRMSGMLVDCRVPQGIKEMLTPHRDGATSIRSDKSRMTEILKSGAVFSRTVDGKERFDHINVTVSEGRITIESSEYEARRSSHRAKIEVQGPDCQFRVSPEYLFDYLRNLKNDAEFELVFEPKGYRLFALSPGFTHLMTLMVPRENEKKRKPAKP